MSLLWSTCAFFFTINSWLRRSWICLICSFLRGFHSILSQQNVPLLIIFLGRLKKNSFQYFFICCFSQENMTFSNKLTPGDLYLMLVRSYEVQLAVWVIQDRESKFKHLLQEIRENTTLRTICTFCFSVTNGCRLHME